MSTSFLAGLALGLSVAPGCLVTCAPTALVAVAEAPPGQPGQGAAPFTAARSLAWFLAGRLLGYLAIGAAAGALADRLTLAELQKPLGAAFVVLAILLWTRSAETTRESALCRALGGPAGAGRWPLVLGLVTGLQVCPPLLMALGVALARGGAVSGMVHFAGFFVGSSAGLLPLAGWPFVGRALSPARVLALRTAFGLVAGFFFLCLGLDQLFPPPRAVDLSVKEADLKEVMPGATVFRAVRTPPRFEAYRSAADRVPMGACFVTSQVAPSASFGYGGPVPVLVGIDPRGTIVGAKLLAHRETPVYVERIEEPGYLARFRGRRVTEPLELGGDVDAVTAATVTAGAVCAGIREAGRSVARAAFGVEGAAAPAAAASSGPPIGFPPLAAAGWILAVVLAGPLLAGLRRPVLVGSLLVLGVWSMQFFSVTHVVQIGARTWPGPSTSPAWWLLVGVVLAVTLARGRVYCSLLCPFGALTELAHGLNPWRAPVSPEVSRRLRPVRFVLLVVTPAAYFVLRDPDVTLYEPFVPTMAALSGRHFPDDPLVLALLAVVGLVCLGSRRFWCHHLCPAGAALEVVAVAGRGGSGADGEPFDPDAAADRPGPGKGEPR